MTEEMQHLRIFALGGNQVSPSGRTDPHTGKPIIPDVAAQWRHTAETCECLADIIRQHPLDWYVLTHGNGPQVGNILLRAELAKGAIHSLPLDVAVADTQGAMGYMLAQLRNSLAIHGLERVVAETVMQVLVDRDDPDFQDPTKFIGPPYSYEDAHAYARTSGWLVKPYKMDDQGNEIWRRVVPSPVPLDIVELDVVETNLRAGMIPIGIGGGGMPVVEVVPAVEDGEEIYRCNYGITLRRPYRKEVPPARIYRGVEAVIDKDLASSLLGVMLIERARARGEELHASLTIFTDVDGAKLDYQQPSQRDLRVLALSEARALYDAGRFPPGSMGPKVLALIRFLEGGGDEGYITRVEDLGQTLQGKRGTSILPD